MCASGKIEAAAGIKKERAQGMTTALSQGRTIKTGMTPFFSNPNLIIPDSRLKSNMPIDITNLIDPYCKDYKKQKKPKGCELCKCKGCLIWHSIYWRHVIIFSGKHKLPIRRVKCKECGGTFPLLPDFILKYRRYGADVILMAVEEQEKETHEKVASDLCQDYGWEIDAVTVWSWKKKISTSTLKRLRRLLE